MSGSLLGLSAEKVYRWADWYRKRRGITWLSTDELIKVALRVDGTTSRVTKTKLRKAARRVVHDRPAADRFATD